MASTPPSPPTRCPRILTLLTTHPFTIGLLLRLLLTFLLPLLMDDGLLLQGVRYTDIDYDVFTDAARHVANGDSPYRRHTYRYTPFLARWLSFPLEVDRFFDGFGSVGWLGFPLRVFFSERYFGKILFCIADAICGYIIVSLRRRKRASSSSSPTSNTTNTTNNHGWKQWNNFRISPELADALWWLYNPLPINICTRGSAESLVVLLPVLAAVVVADGVIGGGGGDGAGSGGGGGSSPSTSKRGKNFTVPIWIRASLAGIFHGIGIHAKLYPVIYTVSFMANLSHQQQREQTAIREAALRNRGNAGNASTGGREGTMKTETTKVKDTREFGWKYLLSDQLAYLEGCLCCPPSKVNAKTFPWKHPLQILMLGILWVQRLFFTLSSVLFLLFSIGTFAALTYAAYHFYGQESLNEGLLYHFHRVDHRHNYSMYWYWIYLARGRAHQAHQLLSTTSSTSSTGAKESFGLWGNIPVLPQAFLLAFSSLGIAPYDLTFALFLQTFLFVAFNKVITAQYFTWYLCLLPLCSSRVEWNSKRMRVAWGVLLVSIVTWLGSAFSLEMLGWRSHRQVWLASVLFFGGNVNLLSAILDGYGKKKRERALAVLAEPGAGWATTKPKTS